MSRLLARVPFCLWMVFLTLAAWGQDHENVAKGFSADKTYEVSGLDSINLFNGNLNLAIPIGQRYQVSPHLGYQFVLTYSGNNWDTESNPYTVTDSQGNSHQEDRYFRTPQRCEQNAGFGWRLSLGALTGGELGPPECKPVQGHGGYDYTSPDGAKHSFWPRLHHIEHPTAPPPEDGDPYLYANDGSYLRLRPLSGGTAEIDFPDGTIHHFDEQGRLRQMRDPFGNAVNIDYLPNEAAKTTTVTVSDGFRTHTLVYGTITVTPAYAQDPTSFVALQSVDLEAFGGARAVYTFQYQGGNVAVDVSRPIAKGKAVIMDCNVPTTARIPLLAKISLPCPGGCTDYSFQYDRGDVESAAAPAYSDPGLDAGTYATNGTCRMFGSFAGGLQAMTLPTRGSITWDYQTWIFPPETGTKPSWCPGATGPGPCAAFTLQDAIGVGVRTERDADGSVLSKRSYGSALYRTTLQDYHTMITTVTDYAPDAPGGVASRTLNYYCVTGADDAELGRRKGEYGLPYTRVADPEPAPGTQVPNPAAEGGAFLSTKTYDGLGQLITYSYVAYEGDDAEMKEGQFSNRRVKTSSTVYADGPSWTLAQSSDFDGFGHYRVTEKSGSLSPDKVLRTVTAYKPPAAGKWLLNLYDSTSVSDVGENAVETQSSIACFDESTGFLERRRTVRGPAAGRTDLLTVFTPQKNAQNKLTGYVAGEAYYGGDVDATQLPASFDTCGGTLGTPAFAMTYGYQYGVRREAQYSGVGFQSLDIDIDPSTALVSATRDPNQRTTVYAYDALGRVAHIKPPGQAWTKYDYDFTQRSATARQFAAGAAESAQPLTEARYYYDGLGRLIQEKHTMPGGKWATTGRSYDWQGHTKTTTVAKSLSDSGAFAATFPAAVTTLAYDALGRVKENREPDDSTVTTDYVGAAVVSRSVKVATVAHPEGQTSTTTESYDAFGRLTTVGEPGSGNLVWETSYQYDVAGRLKEVSTPDQTRTFHYDGAGLLTEEDHPETAQITYSYDARGHVWRKKIGTSVWLEFAYDAAGRLRTVTDKNSGKALKIFTYDTVEPGRVSTQTRNNDLNYAVTDTFAYEPASGRTESQLTDVEKAGNPQAHVQFNHRFEYTDLGAPSRVLYPTCAACGGTAATERPIDLGYEAGLLTSVAGVTAPLPGEATAGISYSATGNVHQVQHAKAGGGVGVRETFEPDPDGMPRVHAISFDNALDCSGLITSQPAPEAVINSGDSATFTLTLATGASVSWYRGVRGDVSVPLLDQTTATLSTGALTETTFYWARVRSAGSVCAEDSNTFVVTVCQGARVTMPTQDFTGEAISLVQGTSVDLQVTASGTSVSYAWRQVPVTYVAATRSWSAAATGSTAITGDGPAITWTASATGTWGIYAGANGTCGSSERLVKVFTVATVAQCAAPQIVDGFPRELTVRGSRDMLLNVTVNPAVVVQDGAKNYRFRWYVDGAPVFLQGTTIPYDEPSYRVHIETGRIVRFEATLLCGSSESETVSDEVFIWNRESCPNPPLSVDQQQIGASSANRSFTATSLWPGVTFQWFAGDSGNTGAPKATTATYIPPNVAGTYWVRATSECGTTTDSATLTVTTSGCSPVRILRQPHDAETEAGARVTLTYEAFSTPLPNSFHWFEKDGGAAIADSAALEVRPIRTTSYYARAGNGCHTATTSLATVHVTSCSDILVSQAPAQSVSINEGEWATLAMTATSSRTLSYQWYRGTSGDDAAPIDGATSPTYLFQPALTGQYWLRVSIAGGCAIDSATVTVSVCRKPVAVNMTSEHNVQVPQWGTWLIAEGTGDAVSYQWYRGSPQDVSQPVDEGRAILVAPLTTTRYWYRVTSDCASPLADKFADSGVHRVSVCPQITAEPSALKTELMSGGQTTVSITALRGDTIEWYRGNPGNITSGVVATGASFLTPAITANTTYWARVTSGACTKESGSVELRLCTPLTLSWSPQVNTKTTPNFYQVVSPLGVPTGDGVERTFQWYTGDAGDLSHPGSTQAALGIQPTVTMKYWVRVTQVASGCYSDSPTLTIQVCIPTITAQPQPQVIDKIANPAAFATLTVEADAGPHSYQWYIGQPGNVSNAVSGETGKTLLASPAQDTTYWVRVESGCQVTVDSAAATVTVCAAPQITTQPAGGNMTSGASRALTVAASGTELTYAWYKGPSGDVSAPLNKTTPTITVNPTVTTDYWVRVSGRCGAVANSVAARLSVAATITTQPVGGPITSGTTRTLSVVASGTQLTYQWYALNGNAESLINGATASSYTTPAITADSSFFCRVMSGTAVADSQPATLTVCQPRTAASSGSGVSGSTVTLSVITPAADEIYEWYSGASGNTSSPVGSGATATVAPLQTTTYWVRTKRTGCNADSAAITVHVCRPAITAQPQGSTIVSGAQKTLSVTATGTPTLSYQWFIGASGDTSQAISGATANTFTTPSLTATTSYWVRVSSPLVSGCAVTSTNSAAAVVAVCQPPAVTTHPQPTAVTSTQPVTLTVAATGDGLSYQWYEGAAGVVTHPVGTNASTLTITPGSTKSYWVRITGACNTADSNAALISVFPIITTQPADPAICNLGETATLTVTATGTNLTYQWFRRAGASAVWETLPSATAATLTIPVTQMPTVFQVAVKSGNASTASNDAGVTLNTPPTINSITRTFLYTGTYRLTANVPTEQQDLGVTYTWYQGALGNTTTQIGGSYYVTVTPTPPTTYWVRVQYTTTGCSADKAHSF